MKAVRSIEMRGIISTSSSEAMSSSSGGVIEFRKEGGNAMVCESEAKLVRELSIGDKITLHLSRDATRCGLFGQSWPVASTKQP
jgi:hypothetical protein